MKAKYGWCEKWWQYTVKVLMNFERICETQNPITSAVSAINSLPKYQMPRESKRRQAQRMQTNNAHGVLVSLSRNYPMTITNYHPADDQVRHRFCPYLIHMCRLHEQSIGRPNLCPRDRLLCYLDRNYHVHIVGRTVAA
jgi:hypothetical protein